MMPSPSSPSRRKRARSPTSPAASSATTIVNTLTMRRCAAPSWPAIPIAARRAAYAGVDVDWRDVAAQAAIGKTRIDEIDLAAHLPFDVRRSIESGAPSAFKLPSGRSVTLDYRDDGSVLASAKLQELFGLA